MRGKGTGPANIAVLAIGAGLLVVGLSSHAPPWSPPPVPSAPAALAVPPAAKAARHHPQGMRRSVPVVVDIPAIGVHARIIALGVQSDGEVAVPSLSTPFLTSWYDRGPTPGQVGAAVLFGHVDAAGVGPAVFYRLGALQPGNPIYVTRRDNQTAEFRVATVGLYPQNAFPTMRVYGNTGRPTLRLVTCGGQFDWTTHLYLDRTIVFADFAGPARR